MYACITTFAMALTTSSLKDLSIDELKVLVSDSISSRYMPPDQLRKILLGTVRAIRPSQRRLTVEDGKKIMLPRASNDQLKVYIEYLFSDAAPDDEGAWLCAAWRRNMAVHQSVYLQAL